MSDKEMTLQMRIRANANQARAELKKLNKDVAHFTGEGLGGQMGRGSRMAFGMIGKGSRMAFAPLRAFTRGATLAGVATLLLGGAAIKADADYEALQLRLEAVTGSAKQAAAIFKTTEAFSASTPMRLDDLVDAQIILEGIGVKGPKALRNTADAAAAMGREVSDMAMAVASLETEPLRRLGIDLKRAGDVAEFEFRDKMGNVQKITATSIAGARKALLGIWDVKFGGTTSKLAGSVTGLKSTLGDVIKRAFAAIGNGFSPETKRMIAGITDRFNEFVEGGGAAALGEKVGVALRGGMDNAMAAFKTLQDFRDFLRENPDAGAEAFRVVAGSMAEMFATSMVSYLGTMASVFAGIGMLIWSAFEEQFLQTAAGSTVRNKAARTEIDGMGYDQRQALFGQMRDWLKADNPGKVAGFEKSASRFGRVQAMKDYSKHLTPEQEARVATYNRESNFQGYLGDVVTAIPQAGEQLKKDLKEIAARAGTDLTNMGFNPAATHQAHLTAIQNPPAAVPVSAPRTSGIYVDGREWKAQGGPTAQAADSKGRAIIFQIGRLVVPANDSNELVRSVISASGGQMRMSASGAY